LISFAGKTFVFHHVFGFHQFFMIVTEIIASDFWTNSHSAGFGAFHVYAADFM